MLITLLSLATSFGKNETEISGLIWMIQISSSPICPFLMIASLNQHSNDSATQRKGHPPSSILNGKLESFKECIHKNTNPHTKHKKLSNNFAKLRSKNPVMKYFIIRYFLPHNSHFVMYNVKQTKKI
jgi:hypothetical protein